MTRQDLEQLIQSVSQRQRRAALIAAVAAAIASLSGVVLLGLSGWFITGAALAGIAGAAAVQAFNYLLPSAGIRLMAILRTLGRYGERYYSHQAALMVLADLRSHLFSRLLAARGAALRRLSAGDATARLVQDIDSIEDSIVRKPAAPQALAGAACGVLLCALTGWAAALALALVLMVIPPLTRYLSRRLLVTPARDIQHLTGQLKADMVEYAAGSADIAAYGIENATRAALELHAVPLDRARLAFAEGEAVITAALTALGGLAMAAVIGLSQGSLPFTVLAALAAGGAVEAMAAYARGLAREALVSAGLERLAAFTPDTAPSRPHVDIRGKTITISTHRLQRGQRLLITGPSGAGKTRLLETLTGLQTAHTVPLAIDGRDITDCELDDLRPFFAFSPQNAQLISGTIADNLRLARPGVTEAEMWQALTLACLDDELRARPQALESWIGDSGARLSGGQRKRLSLARALLAGRPWLLLDEPSEGLDSATEARLARQLDDWLTRTGTGLILVSHRPALWPLASVRLDLPSGRITMSAPADLEKA